MTDAEREEEFRRYSNSGHKPNWENGRAVLRLLDEARKGVARAMGDAEREARAPAIEEAAQVCDVAMDRAADNEYHYLAQQASECADAIRTLCALATSSDSVRKPMPERGVAERKVRAEVIEEAAQLLYRLGVEHDDHNRIEESRALDAAEQ